MCAEKTNNTDKEAQNSFCRSMEEMMGNCCPDNEEISDCCSQFQEMRRTSTTGKSDFIAMFESMKNRFCVQSKHPQDG